MKGNFKVGLGIRASWFSVFGYLLGMRVIS